MDTIQATTTQPQRAGRGKRWSAEEEERLINELDSGLEFDAIAVLHGRSLTAIKMRFLLHASKAVEEMSLEGAAARFRVSPENLTKFMNKPAPVKKPRKAVKKVAKQAVLPTLEPIAVQGDGQILMEIYQMLRILLQRTAHLEPR